MCKKITRPEKYLCDECGRQIKKINEPCCTICGLPFPPEVGISHPCHECLLQPPPFDWHRSAVCYEGPVKKMVHRFKYRHGHDLTILLAGWMLEKCGDQVKTADFLAPVPLSTKRLKKRTCNQSLVLAQVLSSQTGIPLLCHSLQKARDTAPQTGLSKAERAKNLRGSFVWKDEKIALKGKKILLVDDVYTTGSTLEACSKVLRRLKPESIGALTIAMTPKK